MTEKRYYVNCAGYLCDMDLSNTLSIFECADLLNEQEERIKELEQDLNDALNRIEERSIDVQLLKKENENLNNVLEDFMVMLNRLQAEPNNKSLQSMAKDMLRMMGKDIMGDSE